MNITLTLKLILIKSKITVILTLSLHWLSLETTQKH